MTFDIPVNPKELVTVRDVIPSTRLPKEAEKPASLSSLAQDNTGLRDVLEYKK